jgi:hypothetical protein
VLSNEIFTNLQISYDTKKKTKKKLPEKEQMTTEDVSGIKGIDI